MQECGFSLTYFWVM